MNLVRQLAAAMAAASLLSCSRKNAPESEFSCENLQHRALRCEQDTLDLIKRRITAAEAGAPAAQFAMLERRFRERLRGGGTRKQCEKFGAEASSPRIDQMKTCYAKSGCVLFAECMLELDH